MRSARRRSAPARTYDRNIKLSTVGTGFGFTEGPIWDPAGFHFVLDGHPFEIISGEMHYARIPRESWRARLRMARAMGLTTVSTYVFWNVHEPEPGIYDFTGNKDVAAFIRMAQEERLKVILRPGPYSCAEWDLGGFPAWLLCSTICKSRIHHSKSSTAS
jgi:beta-galactosidase GanA